MAGVGSRRRRPVRQCRSRCHCSRCPRSRSLTLMHHPRRSTRVPQASKFVVSGPSATARTRSTLHSTTIRPTIHFSSRTPPALRRRQLLRLLGQLQPRLPRSRCPPSGRRPRPRGTTTMMTSKPGSQLMTLTARSHVPSPPARRHPSRRRRHPPWAPRAAWPDPRQAPPHLQPPPPPPLPPPLPAALAVAVARQPQDRWARTRAAIAACGKLTCTRPFCTASTAMPSTYAPC